VHGGLAMRQWLRVAGLIGAIVAAPACNHGRPATEPGPVPSEVGVEVENQSPASWTVYLMTGSVRQRLGQVNAQGLLAITQPWADWTRGGSVVYLRAEAIGSDERIVSENLHVQPGQVVRWILTPNLRMSRIVLY
jgi:hypothetical protein